MTIIIYPVYMSQHGYHIRFFFFKDLIIRHFPQSLLFLAAVFGDPIPFEQWIKDLSVEYYYDKLTGYLVDEHGLLHQDITACLRLCYS